MFPFQMNVFKKKRYLSKNNDMHKLHKNMKCFQYR